MKTQLWKLTATVFFYKNATCWHQHLEITKLRKHSGQLVDNLLHTQIPNPGKGWRVWVKDVYLLVVVWKKLSPQRVDAKSTPSYSLDLHFSVVQDRSKKGELICSKICSNSSNIILYDKIIHMHYYYQIHEPIGSCFQIQIPFSLIKVSAT